MLFSLLSFNLLSKIAADYIKAIDNDKFIGVDEKSGELVMVSKIKAIKFTRNDEMSGGMIAGTITDPKGSGITAKSNGNAILSDSPSKITIHLVADGGFQIKSDGRCLTEESKSLKFSTCRPKNPSGRFIFTKSKNGQRRESRLKIIDERMKIVQNLDDYINVVELNSSDFQKLLEPYKRTEEEKNSRRRDFLKLNEF